MGNNLSYTAETVLYTINPRDGKPVFAKVIKVETFSKISRPLIQLYNRQPNTESGYTLGLPTPFKAYTLPMTFLLNYGTWGVYSPDWNVWFERWEGSLKKDDRYFRNLARRAETEYKEQYVVPGATSTKSLSADKGNSVRRAPSVGSERSAASSDNYDEAFET